LTVIACSFDCLKRLASHCGAFRVTGLKAGDGRQHLQPRVGAPTGHLPIYFLVRHPIDDVEDVFNALASAASAAVVHAWHDLSYSAALGGPWDPDAIAAFALNVTEVAHGQVDQSGQFGREGVDRDADLAYILTRLVLTVGSREAGEFRGARFSRLCFLYTLALTT
jgi:hypothetical protein